MPHLFATASQRLSQGQDPTSVRANDGRPIVRHDHCRDQSPKNPRRAGTQWAVRNLSEIKSRSGVVVAFRAGASPRPRRRAMVVPAIVAGDPEARRYFESSPGGAWKPVRTDRRSGALPSRAAHSDEILRTVSAQDAPAWWPAFLGPQACPRYLIRRPNRAQLIDPGSESRRDRSKLQRCRRARRCPTPVEHRLRALRTIDQVSGGAPHD